MKTNNTAIVILLAAIAFFLYVLFKPKAATTPGTVQSNPASAGLLPLLFGQKAGAGNTSGSNAFAIASATATGAASLTKTIASIFSSQNNQTAPSAQPILNPANDPNYFVPASATSVVPSDNTFSLSTTPEIDLGLTDPGAGNAAETDTGFNLFTSPTPSADDLFNISS